jgi:hypothetical protein
MQVHTLERILFVAIVCTVVFTGLYLYTYLVSIYQSHWVSIHFLPLCQPDLVQLTRYGIAPCTSLSSGRWGVAHYCIMHLPRSMDRTTAA